MGEQSIDSSPGTACVCNRNVIVRIAHISDVHFGKIATDHVVDDLLADLAGQNIDLVALSGDLTQRALVSQFHRARNFIESLPAPSLVVPGNHDVYPWWYLPSRLLWPTNRYKAHINSSLFVHHVSSTCTIAGINSATGLRIKGGLVSDATRKHLKAFFSETPLATRRILMVHHPIAPIPELMPHDLPRNWTSLASLVQDCRIELILCGHLHRSYAGWCTLPDGGKVVVSCAGTATSNRGRGSNKLKNFYSLIDITARNIVLRERIYDPENHRFIVHKEHEFPVDKL